MVRILLTTIGLLLIVASGVAQGILSGRWQDSQELESAAARLKDVPAEIGDWSSQASDLPERQLEIGEIKGYLARTYTNRLTGESVNLLIVCGRPGPISVHTPDVCLRGAGFGLTAPINKHVLQNAESASPIEVFVGDFARSTVAASEQVRVFWTWVGGRMQFTAAENPRFEFAGEPYLYKLYLSRSIVDRTESADGDVSLTLLREIAPELVRRLSSSAAGDAEG